MSPLLNTADAVMRGSTAVDKVYLGANEIWVGDEGPPPEPGDMPTAANTGPAVEPVDIISAAACIAAGGATNKIITGDILLDLALNEEFTLVDCVVQGTFGLDVNFGDPTYLLGDYPTVTHTRCRFDGSFVVVNASHMVMDACNVTFGMGICAPCPTCAGFEDYSVERAMPWVVTNSWFRSIQGTPPEHTEGAHIAGTGQGYQFTNTRFSQEGPENGTQTGALFFHGGGSRFDGCWFDSNGTGVGEDGPTFYTIYSYGLGSGAGDNVFEDCHIQRWLATYIYPDTPEDPVTHATYINCRDFDTDELLVLP